MKVKREIKARGVCLSSIATRLTQAAEPARAGLTPTAQPPRPAARGQCRRQVKAGKSSSSGAAATGLTLGLYPDRPPLMRPETSVESGTTTPSTWLGGEQLQAGQLSMFAPLLPVLRGHEGTANQRGPRPAAPGTPTGALTSPLEASTRQGPSLPVPSSS